MRKIIVDECVEKKRLDKLISDGFDVWTPNPGDSDDVVKKYCKEHGGIILTHDKGYFDTPDAIIYHRRDWGKVYKELKKYL